MFLSQPKSYEEPGLIQITGLQGAIICIGLFFIASTLLKTYFSIDYDVITYYWLSFTVLTGIWELTYVSCKNEVSDIAKNLVSNGEHVWNQTYNLRMILPHNLAKVFYAEYAAYADKLYMWTEYPWNKWSIIVEGTHCVFCGGSALLMFIAYFTKISLFDQFLIQSMSFQCMNSMMYIGMYLIQMGDPNCPNYVSDKFPIKGRGFMLINIFWTLMPLIILTMKLI